MKGDNGYTSMKQELIYTKITNNKHTHDTVTCFNASLKDIGSSDGSPSDFLTNDYVVFYCIWYH